MSSAEIPPEQISEEELMQSFLIKRSSPREIIDQDQLAALLGSQKSDTTTRLIYNAIINQRKHTNRKVSRNIKHNLDETNKIQATPLKVPRLNTTHSTQLVTTIQLIDKLTDELGKYQKKMDHEASTILSTVSKEIDELSDLRYGHPDLGTSVQEAEESINSLEARLSKRS